MNSTIPQYILESVKSNPPVTIVIIALFFGCYCCCCLCYSNFQRTSNPNSNIINFQEARKLNQEYRVNVLIGQENITKQIEQENIDTQMQRSLTYNDTIIHNESENYDGYNKTITCSVCCQNQKNAFIIPCGHCDCVNCLERIKGLNNKCHVCRKPIDEIKKLFL